MVERNRARRCKEGGSEEGKDGRKVEKRKSGKEEVVDEVVEGSVEGDLLEIYRYPFIQLLGEGVTVNTYNQLICIFPEKNC